MAFETIWQMYVLVNEGESFFVGVFQLQSMLLLNSAEYPTSSGGHFTINKDGSL